MRALAVSAAALFLVTSAVLAPFTAQAVSSAAPNVLVILTDDQRADGTMEVGGLPWMDSTLNWFGNGGTRFNQGFVTTPLCCPSRASILSGRYAHNHDVRMLPTTSLTKDERFDQTLTLERYLQRAGYRTGLFGKFLNSWNLNRDPLFWDRWAVLNAGYTSQQVGAVNDQGVVRYGADLPSDFYTTNYVADKAVQFLDEANRTTPATPWFLYVAVTAPHSPFTPEDRYANETVPSMNPPFQTAPAIEEGLGSDWQTKLADKPQWVRDFRCRSLQPGQTEADCPGLTDTSYQNSIETQRANQLRTLESVDNLVDAVVQELRATGDENNTLAFFLSDNGWLLGEHGVRSKGVPYLDSIKVPFFMRWPDGHVAAGAVDNQRLVANIDIAPTVINAINSSATDDTDIAPDVPMDGISLLNPAQARSELLTEFWKSDAVSEQDAPPWASLISPSYQYIENYDPSDERTVRFQEFYDLAQDPWELSNVYGPTGNPAGHDPNANTDRDATRLAARLRQAGTPTSLGFAAQRLVDFEQQKPLDGFDELSQANGSVIREPTTPPPSCERGAYAARAHYGGNGAVGSASGAFDVYWPEGRNVQASGWFLVPPELEAAQQGDFYLVRWDNDRSYSTPADYGGIRVSAQDHKARLVLETPSGTTQIGPAFDVPVGQWFWLWTTQHLSSGPDARSYVFMYNGASGLANWPIYLDSTPNMAAATNDERDFDRVSFGLSDYVGASAADLWFDRAVVGQACP